MSEFQNMFLISILILTILQFELVIPETVQHNFKVSKNQIVDMAASETCLISSLNKTFEITCLGSCNSNVECLTVVYDQSKGITKNCIIYNRYFKSNELKPSSTSTVYEKKSGNYFIRK
jgi:hypothetical protein